MDFCIEKGKVFYLRTARELAGFLPAVREAYRDLLWLYDIARATWQPVTFTPPEVELVACFRDCTPLEHEEPVWFTELEYDHEEWVHCGILESMARDDDVRRPMDSCRIAPSLAEVCALPRLHAATSSLLPESSPGPFQGEEWPLTRKNTNGGSSARVSDPRFSSS